MNRYLKTNRPLVKKKTLRKLSLQTSLFKKMPLFIRGSYRKIYRCLYVMVKWILSLLWCCYYCIMSDAERRRPVEHYCYEGNATKSNMLGNVFDLQIFFCRIVSVFKRNIILWREDDTYSSNRESPRLIQRWRFFVRSFCNCMQLKEFVLELSELAKENVWWRFNSRTCPLHVSLLLFPWYVNISE